ncbi:conserved hypothetical protein [Candidatus Zixiibacteriota bacterium]|nr:conserved hypothetical protein [candidate division Zixibacteria bacterium]
MPKQFTKNKVGDLRPSQLLYSFGIGSMVDLPNLSVMVMGIEDWDTTQMVAIAEDRLLAAVRKEVGNQLERLCFPPIPEQSSLSWGNPFDESARVGVPVAPFPHWVRCPMCDLLAPLDFGVFELKTRAFHHDQTRYVHINCNKAPSPPTVLPARFLMACENGHIDDFPWIQYVHNGSPCKNPVLRLREWGVSGTVSEVQVSCDTCGKKRRMRDAFFEDAKSVMPMCNARRPHLRDHDEAGCKQQMKAILLGASNAWFPITLSSLYIPKAKDKLSRLVETHWNNLIPVTTKDILSAFRQTPLLRPFSEFSDDEVWQAIETKRNADKDGSQERAADLKTPEWEAFTNPDSVGHSDDFELREVDPPEPLREVFERVIKVERIREVRALTGFTRIESPGDYDDIGTIPEEKRAPLSRKPPLWVPAAEIRGEGIFIQFREEILSAWIKKNAEREGEFRQAHINWRKVRGIKPPEAGFPGILYVLLHSFSHALMRQITLECGYTAASIRERIYSRDAGADSTPMSGILIYTGASDSEGTLGGLASLAKPQLLLRHIDQALEAMRLCASDPLCSEHHPFKEGITLHGAACHACLFAPETSCERGNKYLDRTVLVKTFDSNVVPFFG